MKLKYFLQLLILIIITVILIIFYFSFLSEKNDKNKIVINKTEEINNLSNQQDLNILNNIEYNSSDKNGNNYSLNAEKAIISQNIEDKNNVKLENVTSFISIKNKGIIYIYAKNARYNKENHNTSFYNEVKIEYLDNLINSERLDLNFTDGISKIYNNVIVSSSNFKLNTDKILIDMVTGDIKLEMLKKSDKVKLITNYEFIN